MFIPAEVRPSSIFGQGLFPLEPVARGTIICSFTLDSKSITESEYLEAIEKDRYSIVRTGTRYIGKHFTCSDDTQAKLNFFNHSFAPNCLCHCGVVLALHDIPAGQELTVDYRYLIDDTAIGVYNDAITGRPIRGFCARQTLLHTSRKLIELLESLDDQWER